MAKALFGHVAPNAAMRAVDARMASELRRLQERVRDLESMILRLQDENDALARLSGLVGDEAMLDETMLDVSDMPAERKQPEFV